MNIHPLMNQCQNHLSGVLSRYLPTPISTLFEAMHYACLNGGKRLRPLLVYTTATLFDTPWETLDPLAAAIEFIHCYSLVHDDLPIMDNDDLRRGKPTCHKVFGEATALLAGNALLTLAFDILATQEHFPSLPPSIHCQVIQHIARAAGTTGMIQGQSLDLAAEGQLLSIEQLNILHQAKTGALITTSVQCAALATGCAQQSDLDLLQKFGQAIGLAFQIQDDILDTIGQASLMGKEAGRDMKKDKCTYVRLWGVEKAQAQAQHYHAQALASLVSFGPRAEPLRALSTFMIERTC